MFKKSPRRRGSGRASAAARFGGKQPRGASRSGSLAGVYGAESLERRLLLQASPSMLQQTYAVGDGPYSVAVADLANGNPDLVVANQLDADVSVLPGNVNGTFAAQQTFAVGNDPYAVAVADLGNGHPDIVAANFGDATVSVLFGNGDGTFQSQETLAVGNDPYAVAVADLGNGHPDLIVANFGDDTVSVLLGNGGDTFLPQQTFAVGINPSSVAVADLGNGNPDVVVANQSDNTVSVLLGNGNGTFQPQQTVAVGIQPTSVAVATLVTGGFPDLVVANESDGDVGVLLGNGNGTFGAQQTYAVGSDPISVAVGDLGNGQQDLVVANETDNSVGVLFGNGDGTFTRQATFAVGNDPISIAIVGLGTSSPSIVAANYGDNDVSVLLNGLLTLPQASSTTSLITSNDSVPSGTSVTFTATVTTITGNDPSPIGTVTFFDGTTQLGIGDLASDGTATFTTSDLAAGTDSITARYSGDTTYASSTSAALTETVIGTAIPPVFDPTFGADTGGVVTLPFASEQVVPEPSGNVLAVGYQGSVSEGTSQGVLEQLSGTDGSLDQTFGNAGVVVTAAGSAFYAAVIQPADGKIVAVGVNDGEVLVERFNTDGSVDTTFGNGGIATTDFGAGAAAAYSVALEPDGSIVVAGTANGMFALARFTSTGTLDPTFGTGGLVTFSTGVVEQIVETGNGKIAGVGSNGAAVSAFQLNADGSIDTGFGSGGITSITQLTANDPNGSPVPEGLALQPGGDILVTADAVSPEGLGVVRLTPSGQLDTTFGTSAGLSVASFGGTDDRADLVSVDANTSQFALIGTTNVTGTIQSAVAVFNSDGTPDTNFNGTGQITAPAPTPPVQTNEVRAFHPTATDFVFGGFNSNNEFFLGARNATTSVLGLLNSFPPGVSPATAFGKIGHKTVHLAPIVLPNGTTVTIKLSGGSGMAAEEGNQVQLTDLSGSPAITIRTKGGSNSLTLLSMTLDGDLKSLSAPTATLTGTLNVTGTIGQVKLAGISGVIYGGSTIKNVTAPGDMSGSISCAGLLGTVKVGAVSGIIAAATIHSLTAADLTDATILAGANLGTDGEIGGSGTAADSYGAGEIVTMKVTGSIALSFIGAGVNPGPDGVFGTSDDTLIAPGTLHSLTVKGGVDASTKFESGVFPKTVHLPMKVTPAGDAQFIVL